MTYQEALAYLQKKNPLRITIGGDIGSGKSTFAKRLAETLQVERIYIGQLMREEAKRRNMTLDAFSAKLETDDEIDLYMDNLQLETSKKVERGIFEGRLAWHFNVAPDARVFLSVDPEIGAERVFQDTKNTWRDQYKTIQEVMQRNEERKMSEERRYRAYHGLSAYNPQNFDVIVDTSHLTQDQVFEKTVIEIASFCSRS